VAASGTLGQSPRFDARQGQGRPRIRTAQPEERQYSPSSAHLAEELGVPGQLDRVAGRRPLTEARGEPACGTDRDRGFPDHEAPAAQVRGERVNRGVQVLEVCRPANSFARSPL